MQPASGLDTNGKVFRWNGDIYRGIYPAYAECYKKLFYGSLAKELIRLGVIPTEIVSYQLNGFGLILRHKTIPFVSYPMEWCSAMLKDAALLTCDLQLRLLQSGYVLKDGHPWNILFDACRPQFVDVGSISEAPTATSAFLPDFRLGFLYPLLLKYAGFSRLVNAMFLANCRIDQDLRIYRMLVKSLPWRDWFYHRRQDHKLNTIWRKSPTTATRMLRDQILAIPVFPFKTKRMPHLDYRHSNDTAATAPSKIKAVEELIDDLRPRSVLDVHANSDLYARLGQRTGTFVVAAHPDELRLNEIYRRAKSENLNILPVRLDLMWPIFTHGPWGMCGSARERLRSDFIVMLDHMQFLVREQNQAFEDIAFYLSSFCEKWALVEFVEQDRKEPSGHGLLHPGTLSRTDFQAALSKYFQTVTVYRRIDSDRWLILCTRPATTSPAGVAA
jgi:hypothetical protein